MPSYQTSPFSIPQGLQPGRPGYSFGSYNDIVPSTSAYVTNVAVASGVATVSLTVYGGPVPLVNQLITIVGCLIADSSPATEVFNVTNAVVTGVSGFTTGDKSKGTVTFTISPTPNDIASVAATGLAIVEQIELADSISASTAAKGLQFALPAFVGELNGQNISWAWFPASTDVIASISVNFQIALVDQDSQYSTVDTSNAVGGETRALKIPNLNAKFARLTVSAASTSGAYHVVGKIDA
jgi:hypothetical protein